MNILIYGGKGWIGSQFCDFLSQHSISFVISNTRVNMLQDVLNDLNDNKEISHVIFLYYHLNHLKHLVTYLLLY